MIRRVLVVAVALMLSVGIIAQTSLSPEVLLKRAMQLEQVDGNLAGAVRQYQEIVDRYPDRRAVAAQALVRLGGIHERQGRTAEALKTYQRIEKDYPETEFAADARTRMAGLDDSQARETVIWSGPDVGDVYSISPDGRLLAYLDDDDNVAIRDIASGTNRVIVRGSETASAEEIAFSADGTKVAYSWARSDAPRYEVRTADVRDGGNVRVVSTLTEGSLTLYDWSRDGRWIAVDITPPGGNSQYVVIDVANGQQRALKTIAGHMTSDRVVFSPDSRFLAYDRPSDDDPTGSDVFLLPVDGSPEIPAATGPDRQFVAGWSPDARFLLVQIQDGEFSSLVAQPMSNGAPSGLAMTLRRGVAGWATGMTEAGALLFGVNANPMTLYGGSFDTRTGASTATPSPLVFGERNRQPRFSRDGTRLAFLSGVAPPAPSVLRLDSGLRTTLPSMLRVIETYDWSPDDRSFLARGTDFRGRTGIFQIDVTTGNLTPLLNDSREERYFTPHWAADGRHFYYTRGRPLENGPERIIERDLQAGTERVLLDWSQTRTADGAPVPPLRYVRVSPDGQHVAGVSARAQGSAGASVWVASIADHTSKPLLTAPAIAPPSLIWTPDSRAVVIFRPGDTPGDNGALWVVPLDGSSPRKLAIDLPLGQGRGGAALHPDGRRIAFVVGAARSSEIRLLEDFLPAPAGRR
jgi:Tol biopolymer transport system component